MTELLLYAQRAGLDSYAVIGYYKKKSPPVSYKNLNNTVLASAFRSG